MNFLKKLSRIKLISQIFHTIKKYEILLFFFLLGSIVYSNALFDNFIWLDNTYVTSISFQNIHLANIFNGSFATATGYYRPVNGLYYVLLNFLFRQQPFYYHLIQLIVFITNAYLVFKILKTFIKENIAFGLALLFLVHPINELTAVYISASANVLCMFFGLLAFSLSLKLKNSFKEILLIYLFLLMSILSKESGVAFFWLIPIYKVLFKKKNPKLFIITSFVSFIIYLSLRFLMGGFNLALIELYPMARLTFSQKIINIPSILYFYFHKFYFPTNIAVNQLWSYTTISFQHFFEPLIVIIFHLVIEVSVGIYFYKNDKEEFRKFIFFLLIFWSSLALFLQIFPLGNTVSARWFYIPMIGLLGMIGLVTNQFMKNKNMRVILIVIFIFLICNSSISSYMRNSYLKDEVTFFTHFVQIKTNYDLEFNLAYAYFKKGDYDNALIHDQKSIQLFPFDQNIILLGYIYEKKDDIQKAKKYYLQGISTNNYSPHLHSLFIYKLTTTFFIKHNNYQQAKKIADQAVIDYPKDAYMWTLLSIIEYKLDNKTAAIQNILIAENLSPDTPIIDEIYSEIQNNRPLNISIESF